AVSGGETQAKRWPQEIIQQNKDRNFAERYAALKAKYGRRRSSSRTRIETRPTAAGTGSGTVPQEIIQQNKDRNLHRSLIVRFHKELPQEIIQQNKDRNNSSTISSTPSLSGPQEIIQQNKNQNIELSPKAGTRYKR